MIYEFKNLNSCKYIKMFFLRLNSFNFDKIVSKVIVEISSFLIYTSCSFIIIFSKQ